MKVPLWGQALLALAALGSIASAQDRAAESPRNAALILQIQGSPGLARFESVCPADIAGKITPRPRLGEGPTEADCEKDPATCFDACRARDEIACFHLALALESATPSAPQDVLRPLFTVACALGETGGCTNRAAALRNLDDDDPLNHVAEPAHRCEARSFQNSCAHDDAWGCAMYGQAALKGEGMAPNPRLARAMFAKSCRLAPDFEACAFTKDIDPGPR